MTSNRPMNSDAWRICHADVFEGVEAGDLTSLGACTRDSMYKRAFSLYTRGEELTHVYVVKEGEVLLYHLQDGKRAVFDVMGPGDLFGNFSRTPLKVGHFAEATPGTRICKFPVDELLRTLQDHPETMLRTLRLLSERLADYELKIGLCTEEAKEKVYKELLRYQKKTQQEGEPIKMTHQKLAHLTGLNRVTVTRALHTLIDEARVQVNDDGAFVVQG